jgi:dTMP kinase
MNKGLFISLEGPDGSGKSTQLALLKDFLNEHGYKAVITREPGGTAISEKIRELLLNKNYSEMHGRTEALLYAAARAQHVFEVIKPALEKGSIVVCDRYIDSSVAYQGYGRKLGGDVNIINEFAIAGCMPDITFLFRLDPEIGKSRINEKERDRLECEQADFYNEILKGYAELERIHKDRIIGIDARGSVETVQAAIRERLNLILKEKYDDKRYKE